MRTAPSAHTWESSANGTFTVNASPSSANYMEDVGTRITLHLKEDCAEYAEEQRVQSLIQTYSPFIQYPIICGRRS